ncbi:MAG: N-formylglutamate amidohydrolase [Planctomycetes bacterium]|nr:N-formylglutamate amidohydrolase [Planctomycetota bacterium]
MLHIPHASRVIPADLRSTLLLDDDGLRRELHVLTDWFTDELFALPDDVAVAVRHPVSRLIVDPERFVDDGRELMASRGMGVIYTRTSDGAVLRDSPRPRERAALLERFYHPHHQRLSTAVDASLRDHGRALVIDGHSFPSRSLPCHDYQAAETPDVCLGTDEFHTPGWLLDVSRSAFQSVGYTVAVNHPFRGVLVPTAHHRRSPEVRAIMVEINRRCYMDEVEGGKLAGFDACAAKTRTALVAMVAESRRHGPSGDSNVADRRSGR